MTKWQFPYARRFGKKRYTQFSIRETKESADRDADEWRRMGGLARVERFERMATHKLGTTNVRSKVTYWIVYVWG